MPHCILEYSNNTKIDAEVPKFFQNLHSELVATGIFKIGQIKSRACAREQFYVGDGNNTGFIFLQISLLDGRTAEQKAEIGKKAIVLLRDTFAEQVKNLECSMTVELREMVRATHFSVKDL